MITDVTDKTALVTGATGKLSGVLCLQLARAGANLALQYHQNHERARELQKQVEQLGRRCCIYSFDLTVPSAPDQLAKTVFTDFTRVEYLVHAASIFAFKRLNQTDDQLWQTMMDLHVTALFRLVRAMEENFRRQSGSIVTLADIWGLHPKGSFLAYSVSKGALISLTKALADELAPTTTVNVIAPGIVDFPPDFPNSLREKVLHRIPMQRLGTSQEVADLVLYLLTNRYITGQTIAIDGGRSLG